MIFVIVAQRLGLAKGSRRNIPCAKDGRGGTSGITFAFQSIRRSILPQGIKRMTFANRVVVITGASSGIGRALAVALAGEHARVGVTARRAERLDELVCHVRAKGGTIEAQPCDVTDRESTHTAIRWLSGKLGPVDLLIANAGLGQTAGADPMNVPVFEQMVRVNLLGVAFSFEAVMESMLSRKSGHLVAISSLAAYKGMPGSAGYCATKAAVNTYCEGLRIELHNRGIAVTSVCPGFVKTEMTAGKTHPMPLLMDADVAARRIIRALKRRPGVYNFPWRMSLMMRLARMLPDWMLARMVTPAQKQSQDDSVDSPTG
jgi:short-subunit dehydrogenase